MKYAIAYWFTALNSRGTRYEYDVRFHEFEANDNDDAMHKAEEEWKKIPSGNHPNQFIKLVISVDWEPTK